jgi:hypothetical protein
MKAMSSKHAKALLTGGKDYGWGESFSGGWRTGDKVLVPVRGRWMVMDRGDWYFAEDIDEARELAEQLIEGGTAPEVVSSALHWTDVVTLGVVVVIALFLLLVVVLQH